MLEEPNLSNVSLNTTNSYNDKTNEANIKDDDGDLHGG